MREMCNQCRIRRVALCRIWPTITINHSKKTSTDNFAIWIDVSNWYLAKITTLESQSKNEFSFKFLGGGTWRVHILKYRYKIILRCQSFSFNSIINFKMKILFFFFISKLKSSSYTSYEIGRMQSNWDSGHENFPTSQKDLTDFKISMLN